MQRECLASSASSLEFRETTFAAYVAAFPATSVNVILQVGHNTLRLMTAGLENRPVTAAELGTMERMLEEALAAGAWGLSSGLFTAPGNFADAAEIHALARVLRRHGAAYSTHMRDESDHILEAVREAIAVAETTGVHVQIAHLKLRREQLGRSGQAPRRDRGGASARPSRGLRRLSLRHRHQSTAEPTAALGDGRRHPRHARAAARA